MNVRRHLWMTLLALLTTLLDVDVIDLGQKRAVHPAHFIVGDVLFLDSAEDLLMLQELGGRADIIRIRLDPHSTLITIGRRRIPIDAIRVGDLATVQVRTWSPSLLIAIRVRIARARISQTRD